MKLTGPSNLQFQNKSRFETQHYVLDAVFFAVPVPDPGVEGALATDDISPIRRDLCEVANIENKQWG